MGIVLKGVKMQVNQYREICQNIDHDIKDCENEIKSGNLKSAQLEKLDNELKSLKEKVLFSGILEGNTNVTERFGVDATIGSMDQRVKSIREQNLNVLRGKLTEYVTQGILPFRLFEKNSIPFKDKLDIILTNTPKNSEGLPELKITDIPGKGGKVAGEMRCVVRNDPILEGDTVLSQLKDPVYREELLKYKQTPHYAFEFFDVGREPEIKAKREELAKEKNLLEEISNVMSNFYLGFDPDEFNRDFTTEQRSYFGKPEDQILNENDIGELNYVIQDKQAMFPFTEDSIISELQKPTIRCRISEGGEIGELKSVNIHSTILGGKELMDCYDRFCSFMTPASMFLEDDAKIEGKTGSYNLRLFRLIGLDNKNSWYDDAFGYKQYEQVEKNIQEINDPGERAKKRVVKIKSLTLNNLAEDLKQEGMKKNPQLKDTLEKHIKEVSNGEITLSELVRDLGNQVSKSEKPLHKDLDLLLTGVSETYRDYQGNDPRIKGLKEDATFILGDRYMKKTYL